MRQLTIYFLLALLAAGARAEDTVFLNSIGGGLSYGEKLTKSADFWGWTLDYSRLLDSGWVFTAALAYDEETERHSNKPDKVVQTYTPTFSWAYPLSQRWSAGAGFGKGLIDDDNKDGDFEFTKLDEDWAVGAIASFTLLQRGRHRASLSSALEYDISEGEPSLSFDIGYAYSF